MIDFIIKYWIEAVFAVILAGFGTLLRMVHKRIKEALTTQKLTQNGLMAIFM